MKFDDARATKFQLEGSMISKQKSRTKSHNDYRVFTQNIFPTNCLGRENIPNKDTKS